MNCTFYRPKTVNTTEFSNIVGKLHHDLHLLETEKTDYFPVNPCLPGALRPGLAGMELV